LLNDEFEEPFKIELSVILLFGSLLLYNRNKICINSFYFMGKIIVRNNIFLCLYDIPLPIFFPTRNLTPANNNP